MGLENKILDFEGLNYFWGNVKNYLRDTSKIIDITYNDLLELVNTQSLVIGQQYKIIDYTTTTTQENTQSADNVFDIIVTANTNSNLSSVARTSKRVGTTYFDSQNIDAWVIWYDINNDTSKYAWADPVNGKGVIYRMIDDKCNDCPYDFKNIKFVRYELNQPTVENGNDYQNQVVTNVSAAISAGTLSYVYGGFDSLYRYWQNVAEDEDGESTDTNTVFSTTTGVTASFYTFSVTSSNGYDDKSLYSSCTNNTIEPYYDVNTNVLTLNNIIFFNSLISDTCASNKIGLGCSHCSFGTKNENNIILTRCNYMTTGKDFRYNQIGHNVDYLCTKGGFYGNNIGNGSNSISFGDNCRYNTLGNYTDTTGFGDECRYNTFGNSTRANRLGNNCRYNSFGNDCRYNILGNYCYSNTFDNYCRGNSFIRVASGVTALRNYCYFNHFAEGCQYNILQNNKTASSSNKLQNVYVSAGMIATSASTNTILIDILNAQYEVKVAKNKSGDIKIYCDADSIN